MNRDSFFELIKASHFFPSYASEVKNVVNKLRQKNARNNPMDFSTDDKKLIKKGVKALISDLKKLDL